MKPQSLKWIIIVVAAILIFLNSAVYRNPAIIFSRRQAFEDILSDEVKDIYHGLGGPGAEVIIISRKYGFQDYNPGCVDTRDKGEEAYQEIIEKYLDERNGMDWRSKYRSEVQDLHQYQDSMRKLQSSYAK